MLQQKQHRVEGERPRELGALTRLQFLNLAGNALSGELPAASLMDRIDVNGANTHPVYTFLKGDGGAPIDTRGAPLCRAD